MALRIPFLQKHLVVTATLAVALTLLLCGASLSSIAAQLGQPFPGFFYVPDYIVGGTTPQDYTGWLAGLRPRDRILAADGLPPSEIHTAVLRAGIGHAVTYTIQRGGETLQMSVPVMEFTADVLWRFLPASIVFAVVSIAVGIFVFLRNPAGLLNQCLLAYLLGWSCVNLIGWESYLSTIKWSAYLYQSGVAVIAVTGWIFFWSFPADDERRAFLKRVPLIRAFVILAVVAAVYYPAMLALARFLNQPLLWQVETFSATWGAFIVFELGSMFNKPFPLLQVALRKNSTPLVRHQAVVLLAGIVVGLGGYVVFFWTPATIHITPLGNPQWGHVFATLYPLSIGYAILRYQLFDIRVAVRKGLVYSLVTLVLTAFFLILFQATGILFQQFTGRQSVLTALIPALFVAILFQPVRDWIQVQVDRAFFRRAYEMRQAISAFTRDICSLRGPGEVAQLVLRTVRETLGVQQAALWLLDSNANYAVNAGEAARPCIPAQSALVTCLLKERAPLADSHADPRLSQAMAEVGASLVVPLLLAGKLTAILTLGEKRSGEPYSPEDRDLLTAVSQSAALALENSRLYEERIESLHQQLAQVTAAQEEERRRIARELHDGVGPALASVNLRLRTAHKLLGPDNPQVADEIDELADLVQGNIRDIRRLIYDLHPAVLEELGLAAALRNYVERYSRETGLRVNLRLPEDGERLPPAIETILFRAIQESLMNVYRHAGTASQVCVTLAADARQASACIEDNGRGFSVEEALAQARQGGHLGLFSMRERVEAEGGRFQIESRPGAGTTIKLSLPLASTGKG